MEHYITHPRSDYTPYRYGFQGQERDDEIKGAGNSINYKFRMHDPRLGRFFAVAPLKWKFPHFSPYSFSGNMLIHMVELEGAENTEPSYQEGPYSYKFNVDKFKEANPKEPKEVEKKVYTVTDNSYQTIRFGRIKFFSKLFGNGTKVKTTIRKFKLDYDEMIVDAGANDDTGNDLLSIHTVKEDGSTGHNVMTYTMRDKDTEREMKDNEQSTSVSTSVRIGNKGKGQRIRIIATGGVDSDIPRAFGGSVISVTKKVRRNIFGKVKTYTKKRADRIQKRIDKKYAKKTS